MSNGYTKINRYIYYDEIKPYIQYCAVKYFRNKIRSFSEK